MPMFPPDLSAALRSLQRQIDQINTARPGPMSWGPGDGHTRFYGADGTTVLFEAVGGVGASVVSRGALTGMTGLLDGIRDTNDAQSGRLNDQQGWIVGHGTRLDGIDTMNDAQNGRLNDHTGWIAGHTARLDAVDATDNAQNGRLNDHSGWIVNAANAASTAQSRADSAYTRAGTGISNAATAQSRADSAYSRAGTGISDAATAQARADSAYARASSAVGDAASAQSTANSAQSSAAKIAAWIRNAVNQDPTGLPPWGGL